jgi:hypothetical protein
MATVRTSGRRHRIRIRVDDDGEWSPPYPLTSELDHPRPSSHPSLGLCISAVKGVTYRQPPWSPQATITSPWGHVEALTIRSISAKNSV